MRKNKIVIFYCNYLETIFRDEKTNYTIFSVKTKDVGMAEYEDRYGSIVCKGCIPIYTRNMPLKITGEIIVDRQNRQQILIKEIIEEVESKEVAINYLMESCKGIGEKTARKIVEKIGFNLFNYKKETLLTVLSEEKADVILKTIETTVVQREIFELISKYGCSYLDAIKIFKEFGVISMRKLNTNPYQTHLPFSIKEKIAMDLGMDFFDNRRINGIIAEIFEKDLGHTFIEIKQLEILVRYLEKLSPYDAELPLILILKEIYKNKNYIIEKANQLRIFRKDLWYAENNIVKHIKRIENTKENFCFNRNMIEELEEKSGIKYHKAQKDAIKNVLSSSGFKILTGGPGTGKSTTINAIIEIYERIFPEKKQIKLCAPTGRASQRITEITNREAKTIHKTLEYSIKNDIISHLDEENPIDADFIIVDEASMVDTKIMAMILAAVKNGSLFLFVGDEDQLPSVGSGNVLHDLIDSEVVEVNELSRVFRQSNESSIVNNCFKVKKGRLDLEEAVDFRIINTNSNKEMIDVLNKEMKCNYDISNPYKIQVLSPSRKGDVGCNNINKILQKLVNNVDNKNKKIYYGSNIFCVDDKVILNRNNYSTDTPYHNGDIGLIKNIVNSDLILEINNKEVILTKENLEDLSLSYDITIHKSQGSEYEKVIILLPVNPKNMLQRNLLFTAISRARNEVVIITQENSLQLAIENIKNNERKTSLKEKMLSINYEIIRTR